MAAAHANPMLPEHSDVRRAGGTAAERVQVPGR